MSELAKMYKNAGKGEQDLSRRRRTEETIELRRQKRGNELNKRRNIDAKSDIESEVSDVEKAATPRIIPPKEAFQILTNDPSLKNLQTVFESLRRQLSRSKEPPVDEIIAAGLLPAFVQGLGYQDPKVQYECAWALTNVVSGTADQTHQAVHAGATVAFLSGVHSAHENVIEQCWWGLANIVGDGVATRDHAIQCGVIAEFAKSCQNVQKLSFNQASTLSWMSSNLCRHKQPQIPREAQAILMPCMMELMKYPDDRIKQDVCWAFSYLSDGDDDQLAFLLSFNILDVITPLLKSTSDSLIAPAVRVCGNFVSGSDGPTQAVLNCGILNDVPRLFRSTANSVHKEVCWMLSNVLAGNEDQVQAVYDAGLIPFLIRELEREFKVQNEAVWCFSNICHSGSQPQIVELARAGVIAAITPCLNISHGEFQSNIMLVVEAVLNAAANLEPGNLEKYKDQFEENDGLDILEEVQRTGTDKMYSTAYNIIAQFFNDDNDEDLDPNVGTSTNNENVVFKF